MSVTISGNAFTRQASQLQPNSKLVYGWNADYAVRAQEKLPRTFFNYDKGTMRVLDKTKTQAFIQ